VSWFAEARDEITGDSWLDDMARASLSAAEAKFSPGDAPGTSIRYVPESAVAEAVAAERDRCIRLAVEHGAVYFAEPRPCTCKPGCAQVVSRAPFAPLLGGES
jgi:hypothetical protein